MVLMCCILHDTETERRVVEKGQKTSSLSSAMNLLSLPIRDGGDDFIWGFGQTKVAFRWDY